LTQGLTQGEQASVPVIALPPAIISSREPIIEIENATKVYQMGEVEVHALRGISLTVTAGEYVAIVGASGSGKSTLMNIIGLLDSPTSGSYCIRGTEVSQLGKNQLADLRNREIGFIFQRFNLLARTSARRQVELPLFYAGVTGGEARTRALDSLARVGLRERADHRPDELSGGQQQRVAIARALVNRPQLLLADEPTGALDTKTGAEVLTLFDELHQQGLTLVVVTHDWDVAHRAERIITISDGQIVEDRRVQRDEQPTDALSHSIPHSVPSNNGDDATAHVETTTDAAPMGTVLGSEEERA
jgi:putative ABC transport system ATP-binding protein